MISLQEIDLVRVEIEIGFSGRENQAAPKRDLDNILAAATDIGIVGEPTTGARNHCLKYGVMD